MPADVLTIAENQQELRRSLRDLVAVSMLPTIWTNYSARDIAESVTELMVKMIGLEFACLSLPWRSGEPPIEATWTRDRTNIDGPKALYDALNMSRAEPPPYQTVTIANPLGLGSVRVVFNLISAGEIGMIAAGSLQAEFPSPAQRLLLTAIANQATMAIERWKTAQGLKQLQETLEQRVVAEIDQRTKAEEAVRMSQRLATLGQLAGGIAHDFNNLLTVMMGNSETLAEELSHDRHLQSLAEMIHTATERGADMIRHLLAFSLRQPLEPKAIDVRALVVRVLPLLRRSIGTDIKIETVLGHDPKTALADPAQVESAILNLSLNARDAMPNGGHLTIKVTNSEIAEAAALAIEGLTPGRYVVIAVSDNGGGMSEEVAAHAFEPFFTTKEVGKGTGLGLSMIYGFAKQSGGSAAIDSTLDQGTTVTIYLPMALEIVATVDQAASQAVIGGTESILLVEDDTLVLEYARTQLHSLGYRVTVAADGHEALAALNKAGRFDLLFTDMIMPGGMNGQQLAVATQPIQSDLRVLFTSGYAEGAIVHQGRVNTGVNLLRKPYSRQELAARIRLVLDEPLVKARYG